MKVHLFYGVILLILGVALAYYGMNITAVLFIGDGLMEICEHV